MMFVEHTAVKSSFIRDRFVCYKRGNQHQYIIKLTKCCCINFDDNPKRNVIYYCCHQSRGYKHKMITNNIMFTSLLCFIYLKH